MKVCPYCATPFHGQDWKCPFCDKAPSYHEGFPILAPEINSGSGGFRPEYFSQLAQLEAGNFWFRQRNQLIVWALRRFFPTICQYLEIGCGTGYVLSGVARAYPKATITGSEIHSEGLPYAARRVEGATLLQMDARHIPFSDEFDAIGAFDVLEHIEEDEQVLSEMRRALRPGGGIAITVPQHPWLWSVQDEYACHVRRYAVGELRRKVIRGGFKVVLETSFVSLLLPAMMISRKLRRKEKAASDSSAELRLSPTVNTLFENVMRAERQMIGWGARFPAGGSLLLLAQKLE